MDVRAYVPCLLKVGSAREHGYGTLWRPEHKLGYHPQKGCQPPPQGFSCAWSSPVSRSWLESTPRRPLLCLPTTGITSSDAPPGQHLHLTSSVLLSSVLPPLRQGLGRGQAGRCILRPFFSFSYSLSVFYFIFLTAMIRISSTLWNRSGKSRHSCLSPDLRGKHSRFCHEE